MTYLVEFLLARISEKEGVAREATNDGHKWLVEEETIGLWPDDHDPADGYLHFPRKIHACHAATWSPDRVLAECAAKRVIIDLCLQSPASPILLALAQPDSSHPDFRKEWKI